MVSIEQAKLMAKQLRTSLSARNQDISHAQALELVSQQLGYKDWNTASALLAQPNIPSGVTPA